MRIVAFSMLLFASLASSPLGASDTRTGTSEGAGEGASDQAEFFEKKVRPLLVKHCFECHSAQSQPIKGGLQLDSAAATVQGGESGAVIVAGKPDESPLIRAVRWQSAEMPPNGKLKEFEIAELVKWVELGAPWPKETDPTTAPVERSYDWKKLRDEHWAFRPIELPALPTVIRVEWPKTEIDYFILAKLEAEGLKPNEPASTRAILRRLHYDLTGLPPTPEETRKFGELVSADREKAIELWVDRLLESPQYGERWGRHWLDVARYSDGFGGFLDNAALPNAWRYRDWVVAAFNRDLPFDEFVRLQIAADLIDSEQVVATGFLALGPTYISDGGDPDAKAQAMSETLDDRIDTVTRGFMALTVSCARCHDHRFDPLPQLDYYSLAGVFNNSKNHDLPLARPEEVAAFQTAEQAIKKIDAAIKKIKNKLKKEKRESSDEERGELEQWEKELAELNKQLPKKYGFVHAMADTGDADMNLAVRGNLLKPGPIAPRRFLRIIEGDEPALFKSGSGRVDLANALTGSANPLTPRVMVNRVWQHYFGHGLVRTISNFGALGESPSHPELLDWMAAKFRSTEADGFRWSLKKLHRVLVLSATYQMSSSPNVKALERDGDNRWLWRFSPRQYDVEAWRDAILSFTGELNTELGGPSIADISSSARRTLYASVSRNGDQFSSDALLRLFDFPVPRATSEGRKPSIVPQQALFLMNSPFMAERSKALAARLHHEFKTDTERVQAAYVGLYNRPASPEELQLALEFLQAKSQSEVVLSRWEQYGQVLLSASEITYLD